MEWCIDACGVGALAGNKKLESYANFGLESSKMDDPVYKFRYPTRRIVRFRLLVVFVANYGLFVLLFSFSLKFFLVRFKLRKGDMIEGNIR